MLISFYKENIFYSFYPGYIDTSLEKIVQYGTPNLISERGYPILARYQGLCLVMTRSGINEWYESTCGTCSTVSIEEYMYLLRMYHTLKVLARSQRGQTDSRPYCEVCRYQRHLNLCKSNLLEKKKRNGFYIHPASDFYKRKQRALELYAQQLFKQEAINHSFVTI